MDVTLVPPPGGYRSWTVVSTPDGPVAVRDPIHAVVSDERVPYELELELRVSPVGSTRDQHGNYTPDPLRVECDRLVVTRTRRPHHVDGTAGPAAR